MNERTHGIYYRQAIGIAFCQPTVRGIFLFHLYDELDRNRWQSGLYYVDRTPKRSLPAIRRALRDSRGGVVARCPGMALRVKASTRFAPAQELSRARLGFRLRCDIDCSYLARVERLPKRTVALTARGRALGGVTTRVSLRSGRLAPGRYRIALSLVAPVNRGPETLRASAPFTIRKAAVGRTPSAR